MLELPQSLQSAVGPSYSAVILGDNPVVYWRLDETSGSTANNLGSLGAAANGTYGSTTQLNQPTAVLNTGGNAAAGFLQQTTTYVQKTNFAGWPSGDFSVEFWMNETSATNANKIALVSYASPTSDNGFIAYSPSATSFYLNGTNHAISPSVNLADNTWHHIVATYVQSLGELDFYKDGSLAGSTVFVPGVGIAAGGALVIGQEQDLVGPNGGGFDASQAYQGLLDEFALYGYALTPSQIAAHYEQGTIQYIAPPSLTPEPWSWALLAVGLAGLGYVQFRSARRRTAARQA